MNNIFELYDKLNEIPDHKNSKDDICTPMLCVKRMVDYIPQDFWISNKNILDPCCGNGNFGAYIMSKTPIDNIYFSDINDIRLGLCKEILNPKHIENKNVFELVEKKWDLIITNPPYSGGGNKNTSLSNAIIEHCIDILNDKGYICFVTPNNWMTFNNNNTTLKKLLNNGSFLIIDNDVKKYFPSVGSSFTIFLWQKGVFDIKTKVYNNYIIHDEQEVIIPKDIRFIPLYLSQTMLDILSKTVLTERNQFTYRCDLHNFTKKDLLSDRQDSTFIYETIHTPSKTRYASIMQDIYNRWVIIVPLSSYYKPYIKHNVNVTQSVGYVAFDTEDEAKEFLVLMEEKWIKAVINVTRYGNFNNILVLKYINYEYNSGFTEEEQKIIDILSNKF